MISAQMVKDLREKTGCGMMECKKALSASDGDMEKAIEFLRERGLAVAAKKSGRIASEGIVKAMEQDGVGVLVEVNAETDFVAKNSDFQTFVANVAEQILKNDPADVDALLAEKALFADSTVEAALQDKIATIGENMKIRRFVRYAGVVKSYIHGGGRIGVLVEFQLGDASKAADEKFDAFAKDIAMQVAASMPQYVNKDSVPAEVVEKEKEILKAQAVNEGKPEAIAEKMVMGRIAKFYKEVCLIEQPYIKDPDKNVTAFIKETGDAIGTDISVVRFTRFEKGEGLEKKEDNFAEEVAGMMK